MPRFLPAIFLVLQLLSGLLPGAPNLRNATGHYDVEVGRIRQSIVFGDHGLEFFVSGDQLLRGAALNAVIIAEKAVKEPGGTGSGRGRRGCSDPEFLLVCRAF